MGRGKGRECETETLRWGSYYHLSPQAIKNEKVGGGGVDKKKKKKQAGRQVRKIRWGIWGTYIVILLFIHLKKK